jgi:uncharacterized protein
MSGAVPAREVRVYRSTRKQEMYLYVDVADALERVPAALLQRFGRPVQAMELTLTPDRKLARVDVAKVLAALAQEGYYLQLPPPDNYGHVT